ncbi:hypothetical protein JKP88DRAFT_249228 [Tribonema minus]|uniref:G-patch domain-containing protein n=1 Tax=Tribonema minus TaxID=303371 RepID=A0A835YJV6_9STRA|nr:hypothetical protein JKP88DRAFT_249228 [Tribonema minus]
MRQRMAEVTARGLEQSQPPLPPGDPAAAVARAGSGIADWVDADTVIGLGFARPEPEDLLDDAPGLHTPIPTTSRGFRLLRLLGWKEGEGLGKNGQGIREPITIREESTGLGLGKASEYDAVTAEATRSRKLLTSEKVESAEEAQRRAAEGAQLEKTRADVREMNRMFYCEDCDKQYKTVGEFANHLSSYDHHHKKRLVDLQKADRARKGSGFDRDKAKKKDD